MFMFFIFYFLFFVLNLSGFLGSRNAHIKKMQPCGELDLEKKCALVSDYIPKVNKLILLLLLLLSPGFHRNKLFEYFFFQQLVLFWLVSIIL